MKWLFKYSSTGETVYCMVAEAAEYNKIEEAWAKLIKAQPELLYPVVME